MSDDKPAPAEPEPPAPQRWWLRRWVNRMELDRATFYVVSTRGWRLLAGPVTMLLITQFFSEDVQGYYFTFWHLLSVQALVDIGISAVIIQCASHEWAGLWLEQGAVAGPPEQREHLAALAVFFRRWFLRASAAFVVVVAPLGVLFFQDGSASSHSVHWLAPWIALTAMTGVSLTMTPRIALLEGCGQIAAVNRMRLMQMMCGNLGVWTSIALGLNLWVTVVAAGIQVAGELALIGSFRSFFQSLPTTAAGAQPRDWLQLVRPMQRRLGLQTAVKFFANNLLTPVILRYQGAAAAGRVGMTWNLLQTLQHAAIAWVQTRAPLFGQYVAKQEYAKLDRVFLRLTAIAGGIMAVGSGAVCLGVTALRLLPWRVAELLAQRMLGPAETVLLSAVLTSMLVSSALGMYLQAYRRAPHAWLIVASDLLTALLVWQLGSRFGPLPAIAGMLGATVLLRLPGMFWLWHKYRRSWQAQPPGRSQAREPGQAP